MYPHSLDEPQLAATHLTMEYLEGDLGNACRVMAGSAHFDSNLTDKVRNQVEQRSRQLKTGFEVSKHHIAALLEEIAARLAAVESRIRSEGLEDLLQRLEEEKHERIAATERASKSLDALEQRLDALDFLDSAREAETGLSRADLLQAVEEERCRYISSMQAAARRAAELEDEIEAMSLGLEMPQAGASGTTRKQQLAKARRLGGKLAGTLAGKSGKLAGKLAKKLAGTGKAGGSEPPLHSADVSLGLCVESEEEDAWTIGARSSDGELCEDDFPFADDAPKSQAGASAGSPDLMAFIDHSGYASAELAQTSTRETKPVSKHAASMDSGQLLDQDVDLLGLGAAPAMDSGSKPVDLLDLG
eukprot:TRINITY_DN28077_c0_g1_i1.p1 TRINITY_DN28077_c0_g1~~TRINITY_DN28077_c0_g1_i1.p1  ORF type:complete len:360 (+),score=82.65 TRINITY_DN28077_c0_g1_i1:96-1175(+)